MNKKIEKKEQGQSMETKSEETSKKPFQVTPIITVADAPPHPLNELLNSSECPELKAVSVVHLPGTNLYVSIAITYKGNQILRMDVGEPNLRSIAEDEAKIEFTQAFMAVDL